MAIVDPRPFCRTHDLRKGEHVTAPSPGWVYISPHLVEKPRRRSLRRTMVRVVREDTGAAIHRRLRFGPRLTKGNGDDRPAEMGLDWDSWLELLDDEEDPTAPVHLRIEPSRSFLAAVGLGHPDPNVHAAAVLGLLGALTGLTSLLASALTVLG